MIIVLMCCGVWLLLCPLLYAVSFTLYILYLRDVVSAVIATATCPAGWVAGCPSHSSIVSKRLHLSENFFDRLKAPSFYFLQTPADTQFQGEPLQRGR